MCFSRTDASTDMQHDLPGPTRDPDKNVCRIKGNRMASKF